VYQCYDDAEEASAKEHGDFNGASDSDEEVYNTISLIGYRSKIYLILLYGIRLQDWTTSLLMNQSIYLFSALLSTCTTA
jgi:hypothetical protein